MKGHPKGCAPRGVTKLKGYASGGQVKVNTFRSDAEKKVDAIYGPKPTPTATDRLEDKIDKAGG